MQNVFFTFISFFSAFVFGLLILPEVIKVIVKNNVFDVPGGRKIHTYQVPSLGGAGIFLAFMLSSLLWLDSMDTSIFRYLYFSLTLLFFIGVRDDMLALSARNKLIFQIVASGVVVGLGNVQLTSFYSLYPGPVFEEWFAFSLTLFVIITITNAFNLIDGINGLAGGIAFISTVSFGSYFFSIDELSLAILNFSLAGSVFAFMFFNWGKAKIFMGDTGSLVLGFFIATMMVVFINTPDSLDLFRHQFTSKVSLMVALLVYPLFDTSRVFTLRILRGRSPFSPDKTHIHHILVRTGASHAKTSAIILLATLCFIAVTLVLNLFFNDLLVVLIQVLSFIIIPAALRLRFNRKKWTLK